MKVLYFDSIMPESQNGGNIGFVRNLAMVRYVFGRENVYECSLHTPSGLQRLINYALDRSYYSCNINDRIISEAIACGPYDFIFLNGPLVYKYIKPFLANNPIVYLYCHNVDYDYYRNKYEHSKSAPDLFMSKYIKRMESYVVKKSALISTLNSRDAQSLKRWYNSEADYILPIAMDDLGEESLNTCGSPSVYYGLFVGSAIAPNIEGLKWFFENVAPFTKGLQYKIVGSCCDYFRNQDLPSNVILEGGVDDLDSFYRNASFVICPIFSGSGMKTKTIEALRYGKTIIGTKEAFEGIDVNFDGVGLKSDNPEDHIKKILELDLKSLINEVSLSEFKDKFTYSVVFDKFKNIVSNYLQS